MAKVSAHIVLGWRIALHAFYVFITAGSLRIGSGLRFESRAVHLYFKIIEKQIFPFLFFFFFFFFI